MKTRLERAQQELGDIEVQLAGVRRVIRESRPGGSLAVAGQTRLLTIRDSRAAQTIEAQLVARQGALQRVVATHRLRLV